MRRTGGARGTHGTAHETGAHGDATADLDTNPNAHTYADSPCAVDDRLARVGLAAQPGAPGCVADAARRNDRQRNDHGDRHGP